MTFAEKINSRKFILAVGSILLATVLLVTGQIEPDNFVTIVISIGGAYMVSQAYVDGKRNA
jgi:hypothetical protein